MPIGLQSLAEANDPVKIVRCSINENLGGLDRILDVSRDLHRWLRLPIKVRDSFEAFGKEQCVPTKPK